MDESSRSLIVKGKKNKNPEGAQAFFFKKSQLFLNFFRRLANAGKILGFGAICRLADSVIWGIWRGSVSGLRRLSLGFGL